MSKININLRNQMLRMVPGNVPIISGSQEFVKFHFELDSDWQQLTERVSRWTYRETGTRCSRRNRSEKI